MTLYVRQYLCLGCGLCARTCIYDAITFQGGKAQIVQNRCNQCGDCISVCPSGAIARQPEPVSLDALKSDVAELEETVDQLLQRIEKCMLRGKE